MMKFLTLWDFYSNATIYTIAIFSHTQPICTVVLQKIRKVFIFRFITILATLYFRLYFSHLLCALIRQCSVIGKRMIKGKNHKRNKHLF